MADNNREPSGNRSDKRAVLITAAIVVVVLALFLLYDGGFRTASDSPSGGPDQDAAPTQTEETAPTTPQSPR